MWEESVGAIKESGKDSLCPILVATLVFAFFLPRVCLASDFIVKRGTVRVDYKRKFAVVIGIDYRNEDLDKKVRKNFGRLDHSVNDSSKIAKMLQNEFGFHVLTSNLDSGACTKSEFVGLLNQLAELRPNEEDCILFFFAGHGTDQHELVCSNSVTTDDGRQNFIKSGDIQEWLNKLKCRHKLVVLDSCFSGIFCDQINLDSTGIVESAVPSRNFETTYLYQPASFCLFAGRDTPVADGLGESAHSIFTAALLRVLRQRADSTRENQSFSFRELAARVEAQVRNNPSASQVPGYRRLARGNGDLVFVPIGLVTTQQSMIEVASYASSINTAMKYLEQRKFQRCRSMLISLRELSNDQLGFEWSFLLDKSVQGNVVFEGHGSPATKIQTSQDKISVTYADGTRRVWDESLRKMISFNPPFIFLPLPGVRYEKYCDFIRISKSKEKGIEATNLRLAKSISFDRCKTLPNLLITPDEKTAVFEFDTSDPTPVVHVSFTEKSVFLGPERTIDEFGLVVWNLESNEYRVFKREGRCFVLSLCPKGEKALVFETTPDSKRPKLYIFDLNTGEFSFQLKYPKGDQRIVNFLFSQSSNSVIARSLRNQVFEWELQRKTKEAKTVILPAKKLPFEASAILDATKLHLVTKSGSKVHVLSRQGKVVYSIDEQSIVLTAKLKSQAYGPSNLLTGDYLGNVRIFSIPNSESKQTVQIEKLDAFALSNHRAGNSRERAQYCCSIHLAYSGESELRLWQLGSGRSSKYWLLATNKDSPTLRFSLPVFSANQNFLAVTLGQPRKGENASELYSFGDDKSILFWDLSKLDTKSQSLDAFASVKPKRQILNYQFNIHPLANEAPGLVVARFGDREKDSEGYNLTTMDLDGNENVVDSAPIIGSQLHFSSKSIIFGRSIRNLDLSKKREFQGSGFVSGVSPKENFYYQTSNGLSLYEFATGKKKWEKPLRGLKLFWIGFSSDEKLIHLFQSIQDFVVDSGTSQRMLVSTLDATTGRIIAEREILDFDSPTFDRNLMMDQKGKRLLVNTDPGLLVLDSFTLQTVCLIEDFKDSRLLKVASDNKTLLFVRDNGEIWSYHAKEFDEIEQKRIWLPSKKKASRKASRFGQWNDVDEVVIRKISYLANTELLKLLPLISTNNFRPEKKGKIIRAMRTRLQEAKNFEVAMQIFATIEKVRSGIGPTKTYKQLRLESIGHANQANSLLYELETEESVFASAVYLRKLAFHSAWSLADQEQAAKLVRGISNWPMYSIGTAPREAQIELSRAIAGLLLKRDSQLETMQAIHRILLDLNYHHTSIQPLLIEMLAQDQKQIAALALSTFDNKRFHSGVEQILFEIVKDGFSFKLFEQSFGSYALPDDIKIRLRALNRLSSLDDEVFSKLFPGDRADLDEKIKELWLQRKKIQELWLQRNESKDGDALNSLRIDLDNLAFQKVVYFVRPFIQSTEKLPRLDNLKLISEMGKEDDKFKNFLVFFFLERIQLNIETLDVTEKATAKEILEVLNNASSDYVLRRRCTRLSRAIDLNLKR